jgi:hypothetical protein
MKPGCNINCKYKCQLNFTKETRQKIFNLYWNLGCLSRQRQFLLKFSSKGLKKNLDTDCPEGNIHTSFICPLKTQLKEFVNNTFYILYLCLRK